MNALYNLALIEGFLAQHPELPKNVHFAQGTPTEIRFAPGGGLDRTRHREPVTFALEYEDGRTEPVHVNLYGTVE